MRSPRSSPIPARRASVPATSTTTRPSGSRACSTGTVDGLRVRARRRAGGCAGRYGPRMADDDALIIQVAQGGAVERRLRAEPPASVASGAAVIGAGPADAEGRLEPP